MGRILKSLSEWSDIIDKIETEGKLNATAQIFKPAGYNLIVTASAELNDKYIISGGNCSRKSSPTGGVLSLGIISHIRFSNTVGSTQIYYINTLNSSSFSMSYYTPSTVEIENNRYIWTFNDESSNLRDILLIIPKYIIDEYDMAFEIAPMQ